MDLISQTDDSFKIEKKLLYVSPSSLRSTEANLVHVLNQCSALSNFYDNVDLVLKSDFSSDKNSMFVKEKFEITNKRLKIISAIRATNMRLVDISISALIRYLKYRHDIIISRNLYFSFIFTFFKSHIFEVHSIPNGWRRFLFKAVIKE